VAKSTKESDDEHSMSSEMEIDGFNKDQESWKLMEVQLDKMAIMNKVGIKSAKVPWLPPPEEGEAEQCARHKHEAMDKQALSEWVNIQLLWQEEEHICQQEVNNKIKNNMQAHWSEEE
jgi:hypothetical protein